MPSGFIEEEDTDQVITLRNSRKAFIGIFSGVALLVVSVHHWRLTGRIALAAGQLEGWVKNQGTWEHFKFNVTQWEDRSFKIDKTHHRHTLG